MLTRLLPLALLAATPGAEPAQDGIAAGTEVAQLSIRERIVIRIPQLREAPPPAPDAAPHAWIEKRAEQCVAAEDIAGAAIPAPDRVDLVLADGRRLRAMLEADCPALDYYFGFYIRPTRDGMVCAGRDAVRSRAGAACPIRAFRRLEPRRPSRFDPGRP